MKVILKWGYDRLPDFVNADQGLVLVVGDLDGDGIAAVGAVPEQDIERPANTRKTDTRLVTK